MKIIYFLQNHSINLPEIWSDCSIYVCLWLIAIVLLAIWSANNYKRSVKLEASEDKANESYKHKNVVLSLSKQIDDLESQNSYLKQAFDSYKYDTQKEIIRLKPFERKRNNKGQFVATSGKGHVKKDWTKASKKELLKEGKRRYSIGTEIECLLDKKYHIIANFNHYCQNKDEIWYFSNKGIGIKIYSNGLWAKIIKS